MFKRKLIAMGLILTIAVGIVCGCTNNTTQLQTTITEATPQETVTPQMETTEVTITERVTTEEATTEEMDKGVMGRVDAEDICKHISVNGKYVEFPWTLNELGDDYIFSATSVNEETKDGAAHISYRGEIIASASAKFTEESEREAVIYEISSWYERGIYLYDIGIDTTKEDIIERFGNPTSVMEGSYDDTYFYTTEDLYLDIKINTDTGKFSRFSIILKEDYIKSIYTYKLYN